MAEEREHDLSKDCWCNPEVIPYDDGVATGEVLRHRTTDETERDSGQHT